jgi:hypothetical protein
VDFVSVSILNADDPRVVRAQVNPSRADCFCQKRF